MPAASENLFTILLRTPDRGSWAQRGFSLLEVLIAMFVLLVGLLALAGQQVRTLALTRDAELRTLVALQAESLAEAMRANPRRSVAGDGTTTLSWEHYVESGYDSHDGSSPVSTCRNAAGCSQQDLAALDLWSFRSGLAGSLGAGKVFKATVCRGSSAPTLADAGCTGRGPLSIRVAWSSRLEGKSRQALASSGRYPSSDTSSSLIENRYVLMFEP